MCPVAIRLMCAYPTIPLQLSPYKSLFHPVSPYTCFHVAHWQFMKILPFHRRTRRTVQDAIVERTPRMVWKLAETFSPSNLA